jgi:hypothetical protein
MFNFNSFNKQQKSNIISGLVSIVIISIFMDGWYGLSTVLFAFTIVVFSSICVETWRAFDSTVIRNVSTGIGVYVGLLFGLSDVRTETIMNHSSFHSIVSFIDVTLITLTVFMVLGHIFDGHIDIWKEKMIKHVHYRH